MRSQGAGVGVATGVRVDVLVRVAVRVEVGGAVVAVLVAALCVPVGATGGVPVAVRFGWAFIPAAYGEWGFRAEAAVPGAADK